MKILCHILVTIALFTFVGGCWGGYVGSSSNESGNSCETYEHKNGIQTTYCDSGNQPPTVRR